MSRAVVNVVVGDERFLKGQARLEAALRSFGETNILPWGAIGWPGAKPLLEKVD